MAEYAAKQVRNYFKWCFVLLLVCAVVYVCGTLPVFRKYLIVPLVVCMCFLCVVAVLAVIMIGLLMQSIVTIVTGLGWKERCLTNKLRSKGVMAQGVELPAEGDVVVRVWYGLGIRPFIGGVVRAYK